jgi:hypothetical protein
MGGFPASRLAVGVNTLETQNRMCYEMFTRASELNGFSNDPDDGFSL